MKPAERIKRLETELAELKKEVTKYTIPRPALKMDTPLLVWDEYTPDLKVCRHFSGFHRNGKVKAWLEGLTSHTVPHSAYNNTWDHYEVVKENK